MNKKKYLVIERCARQDYEYDYEYYVASNILDVVELTELTQNEKRALERAGFACLIIKSTEEVKTILQDIRDKEAKNKLKAEEQKRKRAEAKRLKKAQERKLREEQERKLLEELKGKYE